MKLLRWLSALNPFRRDITIEKLIASGFNLNPNPAGVHLDTAAALGVSAVFCADRVIAEDLATLPMRVYAGDRDDDGAMPVKGDPITRLLRKPNPETTGPVFWSAFQHCANVWGYSLAEIARDGTGTPRELLLIHPTTARVEREAGRLAFFGPNGSGAHERLDPADVLFVPGFSDTGTVGYKLLDVARNTLGMAVAAQRYGAAAFKNGLNPSGAIKHPGILSDQARENMRASWRAMYGGPDQAGVPMVLEEGTGWEKFDLAHNDKLQLAELCEFLVDEVARFFNISPVKLHKLGRATWANLETLNRDHVITTLGPHITRRDAEIDAKLLADGARHCRHIVDRLLTADTATRFGAWNSAIQGGWMTPNEARAREDLPPKPGGDELLIPLNLSPGGKSPPAEGTDDGTGRTDPAQPPE